MQRQNKLVVVIMCGAPCTGKSTWVEKNTNLLAQKYNAPVVVISRDIIRLSVYGSVSHTQTKQKEDEVSKRYYKQLSQASMLDHAVVILDNTHMRESYFQSYLATFKSLIDQKKAEVFIKVTEAPYWKMWFRNIKRKLTTGKYIPKDALKSYYKRFQNIKKVLNEKYKEYLYE